MDKISDWMQISLVSSPDVKAGAVTGRPTLQDVARKAGVSVVTVSRVINNSPLVRIPLAERVKAVIKEIAYVPPAAEKRIKKRRVSVTWRAHQKIGLILAGVFDFKWIGNYAPIYSYAIQGVQDALHRAHFGFVIHQVPKIEELGTLPRHLRVDGLILLSRSYEKQWPMELTRYPVVKVMGSYFDKPCDHVSYDNAAVGRVAAGHFIAKGILDVAVIGSNGHRDVLKERADSFTQHMKNSGGTVLELQSMEILHYGEDIHEMNEPVVRSFIDHLAAHSPRPKGLFLTLDMMAPLVYRLLREKGLEPGRDIEIVSCNNERPFLAGLNPRPATVDIQAERVGDRAVQQLFWRMQNKNDPHIKILVEPSLVL